MLQYVPALEHAQLNVEVHPLFDDSALLSRYEEGKYGISTILKSFGSRLTVMLSSHTYDLFWIEKEALPWWPIWVEEALLARIPYVLDYDDAVFHQYDQHPIGWVRKLYGDRIDRLMSKAALVICGNDYLAQRARDAGANWVEQLPTVIDLNRYETLIQPEVHVPRVVWIGSPSTAKYLDNLIQPLQRLARHQPFVLRVVGANYSINGVQTESIHWAEATEVQSIAECEVGVMPLFSSPWELGKCGYKLIQYMACCLPVVASPVGVNVNIVSHGVDGFLAEGDDDWFIHLKGLLRDAALRKSMGMAGRRKVEDRFCLQATAPQLVHWLQKIKYLGTRCV